MVKKHSTTDLLQSCLWTTLDNTDPLQAVGVALKGNDTIKGVAQLASKIGSVRFGGVVSGRGHHAEGGESEPWAWVHAKDWGQLSDHYHLEASPISELARKASWSATQNTEQREVFRVAFFKRKEDAVLFGESCKTLRMMGFNECVTRGLKINGAAPENSKDHSSDLWSVKISGMVQFLTFKDTENCAARKKLGSFADLEKALQHTKWVAATNTLGQVRSSANAEETQYTVLREDGKQAREIMEKIRRLVMGDTRISVSDNEYFSKQELLKIGAAMPDLAINSTFRSCTTNKTQQRLF